MSTLKSGHTHSGTLASKICNAHPQAATIATPPARLCQLRLHIVCRCAPVYMCVCVCDLVMAHIYTHTRTYMYTQVFHFQMQAVSAQWDASQGEKEKKTRFQEIQNVGTRFYSTLWIFLRGYSSYFYCFT